MDVSHLHNGRVIIRSWISGRCNTSQAIRMFGAMLYAMNFARRIPHRRPPSLTRNVARGHSKRSRLVVTRASPRRTLWRFRSLIHPPTVTTARISLTTSTDSPADWAQIIFVCFLRPALASLWKSPPTELPPSCGVARERKSFGGPAFPLMGAKSHSRFGSTTDAPLLSHAAGTNARF